MAIVWTSDLATSVDEIDSQHRELFQRINGLLDACNQGRGKIEVQKVITFLEDYVISHFAEEEKYMEEYSYPDAGLHRAQHKEFMESFSNLKRQFETDGPGVHIVISTNQIVVDWLRTHILKLDKSLGAFLKTRLSSGL
jgi:hemerythrin